MAYARSVKALLARGCEVLQILSRSNAACSTPADSLSETQLVCTSDLASALCPPEFAAQQQLPVLQQAGCYHMINCHRLERSSMGSLLCIA
jgi:hypothetical protein